jgi:hypothetical protein
LPPVSLVPHFCAPRARRVDLVRINTLATTLIWLSVTNE